MEKEGTRDQDGMDVKRVWSVHIGKKCDHSSSRSVFHWPLIMMEQDGGGGAPHSGMWAVLSLPTV